MDFIGLRKEFSHGTFSDEYFTANTSTSDSSLSLESLISMAKELKPPRVQPIKLLVTDEGMAQLREIENNSLVPKKPNLAGNISPVFSILVEVDNRIKFTHGNFAFMFKTPEDKIKYCEENHASSTAKM